MKRLMLSSLSTLLVIAVAAPAFAGEKGDGAEIESCQSIPPPSPTGGGSQRRLVAIRECKLEMMIEHQKAMIGEMESHMNAMEKKISTLESRLNNLQNRLEGGGH